MEVRRQVAITNPRGMHARPCHALVSAALEFSSDLRIACGGREVNGKSILSLMSLAAAAGATLEIIADGDDAEALADRMVGLVEAGFNETD